MAEVSRARGSPPLVGRCPQWRQQVSAATCSRARDSTAVKETAARPASAVTAASAARAAINVVHEEQSPGDRGLLDGPVVIGEPDHCPEASSTTCGLSSTRTRSPALISPGIPVTVPFLPATPSWPR